MPWSGSCVARSVDEAVGRRFFWRRVCGPRMDPKASPAGWAIVGGEERTALSSCPASGRTQR